MQIPQQIELSIVQKFACSAVSRVHVFVHVALRPHRLAPFCTPINVCLSVRRSYQKEEDDANHRYNHRVVKQ